MIATHNIKVNGRWIRAGEEYGEPEHKEPKAAEDPEVKEEPAQTKPKTASRRKKTSE